MRFRSYFISKIDTSDKLRFTVQLICLLIFFITFISPQLLYLSYKNYQFQDYFIQIILSPCTLYLLFFIFLSPRFALIIITILISFYPFELVHLYMTQNLIHEGSLNIMFFETANTEATEYVRLYIPMIIFISILFTLYGAGIFLIRLPSSLTKKTKGVFVFIILFSFLLQEFVYFQIHKKNETPYTFGKNTINSYFHNPPINFLFELYLTLKHKNIFLSKNKKIAPVSFHAVKKDHLTENETYVLIIGESARYKNFGFNGYSRNTTPLLSKMSDLIIYNDYYSTCNTTWNSVQSILTGIPLEKFSYSIEQPSIYSLFKETGFSTIWISNQGPQLINYKNIKKNVDRFFELPSSVYLDSSLFPLISQTLKSKAKKKFIVIQLNGNHYLYHKRHPKDYDIYKPNMNDISIRVAVKNKPFFINSYDNSVVYEDYILTTIIHKIQQQNDISFVIFCSDHAESLFDDDRNIFGHGYVLPVKEQLHTPFFIWTSEKYKINYPEKAFALKKNIHSKTSHENLFNTIADMTNIHFDQYDSIKSFACIHYTPPKLRRMINTSGKIFNIP